MTGERGHVTKPWAKPGAALQTPPSLINSFIHSFNHSVMVCENIFYAPPRLQIVLSVIKYFTIFKEILNPEGHRHRNNGSKLVELHWEGSAPAACAAGFFLMFLDIQGLVIISKMKAKKILPVEKWHQIFDRMNCLGLGIRQGLWAISCFWYFFAPFFLAFSEAPFPRTY